LKKILIIKLASLGDVLATTPFFSLLNKKGYSIDHLVDEKCKIITQNNPYVKNIIPISTTDKFKMLTQMAKLLVSKRYDAVFCFHRSSVLGLFARLIGKKVYGFKNNVSFLYTNSIPYQYDGINRTLQEFRLIKMFDSEISEPKKLEFYPKEKNIKHKLPDKYIVCNPGGGINQHSEMTSRRWLPEYFNEVIDKLSLPVVLVGAGKIDEEIGKKITSKNVINLINKTSFDESALIIKNSLVYFGNDSSLLFLSASQGVPSLGIFGPTQPSAANPIGESQYYIASNVECAPCYNPFDGVKGKAYTCTDHICMKEIKPDMVYKKIKEIISKHYDVLC